MRLQLRLSEHKPHDSVCRLIGDSRRFQRVDSCVARFFAVGKGGMTLYAEQLRNRGGAKGLTVVRACFLAVGRGAMILCGGRLWDLVRAWT